jgi:hypothetical protein
LDLPLWTNGKKEKTNEKKKKKEKCPEPKAQGKKIVSNLFLVFIWF